MKKLISALLALFCLLAALSACGKTENEKNEEEEKTKVRVYTLSGPTGMGMAKLINDSKENKTETEYDFTVASSPDQITAEVIKGDFEIAAVPVNLASALYNKTEGEIRVAAVNTLGVLYILENGDTVRSAADLKGQKIYATGQGSTPEYTLRYILSQNGIDPDKDVEIEYFAEHDELAAKMTSGDVKIGMLPEPKVTAVLMNNKDVRIATDLTEEWNKVSDTELIQGCVIVSKKFAEEHKDLLDKFLEEYKASVDFVNENAEDASKMIESAGIIPKAPIAKNALPNCNIVFRSGEEMKKSVSAMLEILNTYNPKSVGGKLPDDAFYYVG